MDQDPRRPKKNRYNQGFFKPKNPKKYDGDVTNIVYRSGWEKKLLTRLDDDPNVISYSSEEVVIPYISPMDGRRHRYFVDALVKVRQQDGSIKTFLIEIKPYSQTKEPVIKKRITKQYITEVATYATNQAKWSAAKKYCDERGWIFQIMTEYELNIKKMPK